MRALIFKCLHTLGATSGEIWHFSHQTFCIPEFLSFRGGLFSISSSANIFQHWAEIGTFFGPNDLFHHHILWKNNKNCDTLPKKSGFSTYKKVGLILGWQFYYFLFDLQCAIFPHKKSFETCFDSPFCFDILKWKHQSWITTSTLVKCKTEENLQWGISISIVRWK